MSYNPHLPPNMKGKINDIDQNHVLTPGCKHACFCCKVGYFNMGGGGGGLSFGARL